MCFKPSLRNACVAAALCLVVQVCNFLSAGFADRPPQRGAARLHGASCRALFTVTDVPQTYAPNASLFVHNRYGYVPADKLSVDWRARQYPDTCDGNDVAGAVQQLLLKRDSPTGAVTTDYSPLAAVLPSVLVLKGEGEVSAPTVTATTRIGAAGGLLPYVPCEIAPYTDPASVAACFRARLAHQDTLWIFFMGDSKIRYLFFEFLARSDDELQYLVKLENGTKSFAEIDRKNFKLKVDMEASSTKLPGLLVSFQFREFNDEMGSKIRGSAEVKQLARWAAGQEALPHLLVISKTTRVIMTSQSRRKMFTAHGKLRLFSMSHGDPAYDWGEAVFLHYLRRDSRHFPPPSRHGRHVSQPRDHLVPDMEDSGVWWWDTTLPLSLAENRECEELYLRGLEHSPTYSSYILKCTDDIHAGGVTLGDQVTMLLNLVCNSVLRARDGLCCG
ncbi:hypothetical protein E2C01_017870 [Portunus trituberculatus]|uniref:Uncharacterized protein n=1 Tax=Portunus trituberculatus TaxID=210409 RepID=A0A5B7DV00_PORTR|nr:hypothetical protein [Portunus trituberculatus]